MTTAIIITQYAGKQMERFPMIDPIKFVTVYQDKVVVATTSPIDYVFDIDDIQSIIFERK
jgi:acid phosphatase class B